MLDLKIDVIQGLYVATMLIAAGIVSYTQLWWVLMIGINIICTTIRLKFDPFNELT